MKLVAILNIDSSWVDEPEINPAYIFNNMSELFQYFNKLGSVEIVREPNPKGCFYDFGEVIFIDKNNSKFVFTCIYSESHSWRKW